MVVNRSSKTRIAQERQDESEDEEEEGEEEYDEVVLDVIIKQYFPDSRVGEEKEEPDETQPESLKKVIEKGVTIIISFIAGFITDLLLKEDETTEITIMVLVMYGIWFTIDQFVRNYIAYLWIVQKNTVYRDVVIAIVNLVSYLGIYTISKLGLDILNGLWETSNINAGEGFISLSSICISLYAVFYTHDHLSR
jgi:hypothetical protein